MPEATQLLPTLSIVVPVYRSSAILPHLVRETKAALSRGPMGGLAFELLLVNDASPDDSWEVIADLASEHDFVRGICLRRNFGQHNAIMAGLHHARGQYVVLMDDDLQHPPAAIPEMVEKLRAGADVCYTRYVDRQHALWKKAGSRFNDYVATLILSKPKGLYLSSFKALRREVVQEIIKYDGPYAYVDGLILDVTRSISVIDVHHQKRLQGEGNYNLRRSISLWLKLATSFSVLPLRIASFTGFMLALGSLLAIVLIVIERLMHPEIAAGWASLIASILFVGGVQLVCLGLLGEYLGRAYLKLNNKPQFVVRETIKVEDA